MILNVLIGDLFVIGLGIDLARPGAIVCRHLATKATTQREMNHLYTEKADIYLAFRLQLVCKYIIIALMYASALPACFLLGFLFFLLSAWVDRRGTSDKLQVK